MTAIQPVFGRTAAISCSHTAAATAGWEMLARGGSVADAALAAAAALTVVLPQASTLGGDGFILYHDAEAGKTFGLNASGLSPSTLDAALLTPAQTERGPLSCTTPAIVSGWEALHQRFGRTPWPQIFSRAIELADRGFPASPGLAAQTRANRALLERDPGAAEVFLKNGPLHAGAVFRQPALAATLKQIAESGAAAFYRGAPAEAISAYIQSRGGVLRKEDFASCTSEWVEPLELNYRGLNVRVMPPNSYGLYMLLQLAALSDARLSKLKADAPERYLALIAAAKAAFAAGDKCVADPTAVGRDLPAAVSAAGLEALRADFEGRVGRGLPNRGGTTVIAVADERGNAAAIVQSVFLVYGSAVADPATGILLNNRVLGFTLEKGHPNAAAPSKRPASTLNPAMTFDEKGLRHILLTPGGPGQTLTLAQVLQAAVDCQMPLYQAAALPRWSMDLSGGVLVENDLPEATFQALRKLDIEVTRGSSELPFFGSAECVERLPNGGLLAVADFRREAHAIAI